MPINKDGLETFGSHTNEDPFGYVVNQALCIQVYEGKWTTGMLDALAKWVLARLPEKDAEVDGAPTLRSVEWPEPDPWLGEWTDHHHRVLGISGVVRSGLRHQISPELVGDPPPGMSTFTCLDALMSQCIQLGYRVAHQAHLLQEKGEEDGQECQG